MSELEPESFYQAHAELCSVFSNANRLRLLDVLSTGEEYTVSDLEAATELPQPTISQHLRVMRTQGLVSRRKSGVKNYYSVADQRIYEAMTTIEAVLEDRPDR